MDNQFKKHEIVFYYNGNSKNSVYEIMLSKSDTKIVDSNFIFGWDNHGNPMGSFYGKFDFILAEYDKNGQFIKNIACLKEEVSKDGIFNIDKEEPTKLQ